MPRTASRAQQKYPGTTLYSHYKATIRPLSNCDETACSGLLQRLQLLTRLESHGLSRGDGNLRAGSRIPPDARLSRLHVEYAETTQLNAVALLERALHTLKDGFHRHFGLGLRDAGPVHNFVNDIQLDQVSLLIGRYSEIGFPTGQPHDKIEFILMSREGLPERSRAVSSEVFRQACGRFATGIAIAGAIDVNGVPHGLTVSSFSSVSL